MVNRLLILLLLVFSASSFAEFRARVDKNPVIVGEFFMLTLELDSTANGQLPDTSTLLKDFVVGRTNTSTQKMNFNGRVSNKTIWNTELMSRNAGQFTIPAFTINNQSTQPITIDVQAISQGANQQADIMVKAEMANTELFVQQAGIYTVKLFLAKELSEGQLGAPTLKDATVSQLGKQTENYEILDGKRFLVITRHYLIQPQKSGQFTIEGPIFKGRIRQNYRSKAASAMAENLDLTVLPIPANVNGNWLPSELVTLDDEWSPNQSEFEVGEPITRTITLTALGITKEQLPEIELTQIKGVRSYSDQAENNHVVRNNQVISQRVESFALMPQKPGQYTLPEVTIPWFNVITKQIEYARLPERNITVTGELQTTTPMPIANAPAQPETIERVVVEYKTNWLITLSGFALWLITLIIWLLQSKRKPAPQKAVEVVHQQQSFDLKQLKAFAKNDQQKALYHGLIQFQKQVLKVPSANLTHLIEMVNDERFTHQVTRLQQNLYANTSQSVELDTIVNMLPVNKKSAQDSTLKSLY